jgi:hemoglobin/transferrin/lactoferrin receptor protein
MKKNILILFLIVFSVLAQSQVLTVKDKGSDQPVEMVTLFSDNPRASALTNAHGQADMNDFKGSAKIEFRMIGYKNQTLSYSEIEKENFVILLEPSSLSLEQYTVVASKWNQSTRDIPAKITSISVQEVALQNPQTAADLLAGSGEVYVQKSQQGGGSPMIRGFATNRILITVDGVRMNTAIFRSGNLQNVISLDPFAIERTEVLFGPGSIIYGSDAIGGVMGFSTLTPKLSIEKKSEVSGNAVTRFSSANNEHTGHFDVNIGWKKFAVVSSFSFFGFDDLRMGKIGPGEYLRNKYVQRIDSIDRVVTNDDPLVQKPSGYDQINMMQKLRFRPNNHWDFTYGFHYSTTTDYSRYDRLLRTKNGLPRSAEWNYGPQDWMMNNLNITNTLSSGIYDQLVIRLTQQFFGESRIDRDFNDAERRSRVEKVNVYAANLDFNKSLSSQHSIMYGLEYVFNDINSTGTDEDISTGIVVDGPARYPMSTWSSSAAYLTYLYRPTDKFTLQTGARYNLYYMQGDFDTTFYPFPYTSMEINDGALTGSLGSVLKPSEDWTISGNLSTGFRAPNVDDAGKVFDSEPGYVIVPNPDLKAEYAYNAELDIAKVFGDFLRLDVAGYYTILEDAMVRRNYTLNGQDSIMYDGEMSQVQAIQNAANATVYGIQAGVEIKLPEGFGITSQLNWQKGAEELDDGTTSPLRHAAPIFGITSLTYSAHKLKLDFYGMYSGEVPYSKLPQEEQGKNYMYAIDADGNPYSPSWYTLNFKASYQLTEHFSVNGGLENITDRRYRPYSSGLVAPGRNFVISLKASF